MLKDKIILVTGGSGLLGSEMLIDLSRKGAIALNLDIHVETNMEKGTIYCDITSDTSIKNTIQLVIDTYSRIDGLVNNAYPRTKDWGEAFEDITAESWRQNVDWQLNSYFLISQVTLKQMRQQGYGSIVNIASIYGVVGNDFSIYEGTPITPVAAYSAIKGGIINLTRHLASLYGQHNVRLNCVSLAGYLITRMKRL